MNVSRLRDFLDYYFVIVYNFNFLQSESMRRYVLLAVLVYSVVVLLLFSVS